MSGFSLNPTRSRSSPWLRILLLGVVAVVSTLGFGSAAAQPQQSRQGAPVTNPQARAADLARPAMVWVRVHFDTWVVTPDGPPIEVPVDFGCSGFVVNPTGYVITAGHCVDEGMDGAQGDALAQVVDGMVQEGYLAESERAEFIEGVRTGAYGWEIEGYDNNSLPKPKVSVTVGAGDVKWKRKITANAKMVDFLKWDDGDVALLKLLKVDQSAGLPSVLLSPNSDIQIGEELLSIGYPAVTSGEESFGLTNRNGQINAEMSKGPSNLPFYETSANLTEGMSGGASVDLDGNVVGLASFTDEDANYIVPASIIHELMTRNGVRNELGRLDELYRQGLESFYRGEYSAAIKSFDQVIALMPGHKQALAKKTKAAELRERFGDPAQPPPAEPDRSITELLVAGAAALVVLAATAGLMLRGRIRKRRRDRVAPKHDSFTGNAPWESAEILPAPHARDASDRVVDRAMGYETGTPEGPDAHIGIGLGHGSRAATAVTVRTSDVATGLPSDAGATRPTRNFCSNCGARLQADDPSCQHCGALPG